MFRRSGWVRIRRHWDVLSNARSHGNNILIVIDDATGSVLSQTRLPGDPNGGAAGITEFEAVELAREIAASKGWPWEEPIDTIRRRRAWFGRHYYWEVLSNTNCTGRNVSVAIDETTGEVLGSGFMPR